jgi:hypothetical protein
MSKRQGWFTIVAYALYNAGFSLTIAGLIVAMSWCDDHKDETASSASVFSGGKSHGSCGNFYRCAAALDSELESHATAGPILVLSRVLDWAW